jgi:hypothetical protein
VKSVSSAAFRNEPDPFTLCIDGNFSCVGPETSPKQAFE